MTVKSPEPKYQILAFSHLLKSSGLLQAIAADRRYSLIEPDSADHALARVSEGDIDLILTDDDGRISLSDLVIRAKGVEPEIPILLYRSGSAAADLLWTTGIEDCLLMPISPTHLLHHISRAIGSRHLAARCGELTKENELLYQLAITDGLTRLVNKRYFLERLTNEFARIKRFGGRLGFVMGDIDHFKLVNDTWGHLAGDVVLRGVAAMILSSVRKIDTAGRYGGEEFVLMLPETSLEGTITVAQKVREAVESHDFSDESEMPTPDHVTISLGCAVYPGTPAQSAEDLISFADQALYAAKQGGRNRVEPYHP